MLACRHGHEEVVRVLLESYAFDLSDGRAMWEACQAEHYHVLRYLIPSNTGLLKHTEHGPNRLSLFQWGALHVKIEVVSLLLERSTELLYHKQLQTGMTALHFAAQNGYHETVTVMLDRYNILGNGTRILKGLCDQRSTTGATALDLAAENGHAIVAKVLLDVGASADSELSEALPIPSYLSAYLLSALSFDKTIKGKEKSNAVHWAAIRGYKDILQIWPNPEQFAHTQVEGSSGQYAVLNLSPLHWAAAYGQAGCVKVLLDRGLEVDMVCSGLTALFIATVVDECAVLEVLLQYGADTEVYCDGRTALHEAVASGQADIVATLLQIDHYEDRSSFLSPKARLEALTTPGGLTALHLAAKNNEADIVKLLVHNGADLEATSGEDSTWGLTALHLAVKQDRADIVELLVQNGADLRAGFGEFGTIGWTALHIAIVKEEISIDVIKVLVSADPELLTMSFDHTASNPPFSRLTILEFAALYSFNFEQSLAILWDLGARDRLETEKGRKIPSALRFAVRAGHLEACRQLLKLERLEMQVLRSLARDADESSSVQRDFYDHEKQRLEIVELFETEISLRARTENVS